jgi:hypothetical protein
MKRLNYLLAFLTLGSMLAPSCKKDSDKDNPAPQGNSFKATVDGQDWESSTTAATYLYGVFTLTGKSASGATMVLRIEPPQGLDPTMVPYYTMPNGASDNVAVYMEKGDTNAYATNQYNGKFDECKLTFSKFNMSTKKVSGTFNIKVKRLFDGKVKTISGSFTDVTYSDVLPPTPDKTMTAKVDGKAWGAKTVNGVYSSMTKTIQIIGNAVDGTTIGITVPSSVKTGSSYTPGSLGTVTAQFNPTPGTYRFANGGSIKITEHDPDAKVIKGTFSFVGEDFQDETLKTEVTEGSFVTTY